MRHADLAKFTQHPDLAELLLATDDAEFVEDSPSEPDWGIGPEGQGQWQARCRFCSNDRREHPTATRWEVAVASSYENRSQVVP